MKKIIKISSIAALSAGLLLGGIGLPSLIATSNPNLNHQLQSDMTTRAVGDETRIEMKLGSRFDVTKESFIVKLRVSNKVIGDVDYLKTKAIFYNLVSSAIWYIDGDFNYNPGTGLITWKLWTNTYKDSNGNTLTDGSATNPNSNWNMQVNIRAVGSVFEVKDTYPQTMTPYECYSYLGGNINNWGEPVDALVSKLTDYFVLENLRGDPATLKITNAHMSGNSDPAKYNQLNFTLTAEVADSWDGSSQIKTLDVTLNLAEQNIPTSYVINSPSSVPADISPTAFISKLKADGAVEGMNSYLELNSTNIEWLKQFGTFIRVYEGSTLYFKQQHTDDATGRLSFAPTADIYYTISGEETGSLGSGADEYGSGLPAIDFTLSNETYIPPKTDIQTIIDSPKIVDETTFLSSIKNADGGWDIPELSKYVNGIDTLPTLATIEEIVYVGEPDATINLPFTMKISGWWNGENFTMEPAKTIELTLNNEKVEPVIPSGETTKVSDPFQWWWIIVGIGGAAIIAIGVWFGIKKYKAIADPKNSTSKTK